MSPELGFPDPELTVLSHKLCLCYADCASEALGALLEIQILALHLETSHLETSPLESPGLRQVSLYAQHRGWLWGAVRWGSSLHTRLLGSPTLLSRHLTGCYVSPSALQVAVRGLPAISSDE